MIAPAISREELEGVLDALPEALVAIDRGERIVLFNRRAAELAGTTAEAAVGRPVCEVIPGCLLPGVLGAERGEGSSREQFCGRPMDTSRMIVRGPDGKVRGAVTIFRDISDVVALTEEVRLLKESRELTEAIIRCSDEAISVADRDGNTVLVNPAYTQIVGLSEEEVLHRPATVDIAEGESVHLRVLRTGEPIRGARLRVGPHKKEVVVNVAPLIVRGELRGSVGVIHDVSAVERMSKALAAARQRIRHLEAKHTFDDIVGESRAITHAKTLARRAAETPATVLLLGESGTGKELFAHAIHHASERRDQPFIRVNCAAIPRELLESELFGYESGAFTGARKGGKKGHFEEADGGTLFLDEIAEAPAELQARLLRTLQEREIVRVGASRPRKVDVRIIAATNADLGKLAERGEFRLDLYYRLNVMPIYIPPLRERREDIPLLAAHLLVKISHDYYQRTLKALAPATVEFLRQQSWPGNVRELENAIGRALIHVQAQDPAIEPSHLVGAGAPRPSPADDAGGYAGGAYAELKDAWEKRLLVSVLEAHQGNRTTAAKSLKISIRALYYKLQHHQLA